jgi:hypothetical protein
MSLEKIKNVNLNDYNNMIKNQFFFDSPTRAKIVELMESKNGKVISNEEFMNLKRKFCMQQDGVSRFVQLKGAVFDRNLEIKNQGFLRVICHIVAVWLRQSITAQAERLILETIFENPSLLRISKNNVFIDDNYKFPNTKDMNIEEDAKGIKKENELLQKSEENISVQKLLQDIQLDAKPNLFKQDEVEEKFQKKSLVYQSIKEMEKKKLAMRQKIIKPVNIAKTNESVMQNTHLTLAKGEYEGEAKDNLPHGKGTLICHNGEAFIGHFTHGEFNYGEYKNSFGSTLSSIDGGKFVDYRLEGRGSYKPPNGGELEGEFIFGSLDFRNIKYK